jgi:hypothetical protein
MLQRQWSTDARENWFDGAPLTRHRVCPNNSHEGDLYLCEFKQFGLMWRTLLPPNIATSDQLEFHLFISSLNPSVGQ